MKNIDFDTLSLMDALDLAILVEEEARDRYEEFGDQMQLHHTADAAAFFRMMAGNEAKHGAELAQRRQAMFGNQPARVTKSMLWDVEAPDYDQARAFMSARQAMQVALESEVKAHNFFELALKHVSDPTVLRLFKELRNEELQHQALVRIQMDRLPAGPEIDPDDYGDEPVAQ